jgi:UDP-3-O-[3-hydroxymyristoyl] N-acetylglucosamine deacetylase
VGTVEHLFSALAGLGVREGLRVEIDGPELPLLDGGASRWCDAITAVAPASAPEPRAPRLRVVREAVIDVMSSRYSFAPAGGVDVAIRLETGDARIQPEARWTGDAGDFRERIAPARTFAMEREVEELARRGLASHVDRESVVVIGNDSVLSAGRPFSADEPARHKLLDFIGDLYLAGGPPLGVVHALRPGHAANERAIRRALELGILARGDG